MTATLTQDEARQVSDEVLRDDAMLPAAVLGLLAEGRLDLAAAREREAAERAAVKAAEDALWAKCFQPFKDAVAALVPAGLLGFVDFREDEFRKEKFHPGHDLPDYHFGTAQAELRCPGCETVSLPFQRHYAAGSWQPWELYAGFHVHPWDADRGQPGRSVAYPTLGYALAVAREAWLARKQYERDVPL